MAKKLDAERIEKARRKSKKTSVKEEAVAQIRDTIAQNRRGERKVTVIEPERSEYACQNLNSKIRVAAYVRVSTQEDAQVGSFEMQIQHFKRIIEQNPQYELVEIYADEGISGTSKENAKKSLPI